MESQALSDSNGLYESMDMGTLFTLHTNYGDIRINIFENHAPKTAKTILGLAQGTLEWTDPRTNAATSKPLYDGTIFHRIIKDFMIQGGDPTGTGSGGPGYMIKDEFSPALKHNKKGLLSMANAGPNTGGSQFFIVYKDTTLGPNYTIFGKVVSGLDIVTKVAACGDATGAGDGAPAQPIGILTATMLKAAS